MQTPLFKCRGRCGQMLPESEFYRSTAYKGKTYRKGECKKCTHRKHWPLRRIPIYLMQPYLNEILNRTDTLRGAARELGITHGTLRLWLGRQVRYYDDGRKKHQLTISRKSAANIILTLRRLRQDDRHRERKAA